MKPKKNSKIFVQIASYRDPQLIPTIKNMLETAKNPKTLPLVLQDNFTLMINLMIYLNMKMMTDSES